MTRRKGRSVHLLFAALASGCMNIPTTSRSAKLATGHATGPTVVAAPLECRRADSFPAGATTNDLLFGDRVRATSARLLPHLRSKGAISFALDPASCRLAHDLRSDVSQRWASWRAPDAALAAMAASGAGSALVTFVAGEVRCAGPTPERRCWDGLVFAGAMLFSRDGDALWRGQAVVVSQSEEPRSAGFDVERDPADVLEDVPIASALRQK